MNWRLWVLIGAILVTVVVMFLFPAIPQNEAYHNFADTRTFLEIPNCLNVISNAFFLLVGLLGIRFVLHSAVRGIAAFVEPGERWPYFVFFVGVALTAFGSSYYHLNPNDHTLIWDRIPMAIGFVALVAATLAERISVKLGIWLLVPLIVLGAASVIYWDVTQSRGHEDLRPYALAQFGSLLVVLLLIVLFPPRYTRTPDLGIALAFYALAKVLEAADKPIFAASHIVSGHALKHLAAALSTYWILRMLRLRTPLKVAHSARSNCPSVFLRLGLLETKNADSPWLCGIIGDIINHRRRKHDLRLLVQDPWRTSLARGRLPAIPAAACNLPDHRRRSGGRPDKARQ